MAKSKVIEDAKKKAALNNNLSTTPSPSNEEPEEVKMRFKNHKKSYLCGRTLTKMIQIPCCCKRSRKGTRTIHT